MPCVQVVSLKPTQGLVRAPGRSRDISLTIPQSRNALLACAGDEPEAHVGPGPCSRAVAGHLLSLFLIEGAAGGVGTGCG